jgi:predicted dehydrogenase
MAQARLRFADGCVADLTASRLSLEPCRKMQLWAPEGYAGLDFARRKLTLVQPSEEFRHLRLRPASADAGWKATLAQDLMSRHLRVEEKDCNHGDQLTRELEDFVRCVRTGSRPRVSGADGRDAVVLAGRVLESLRAHVWDAGDPATRGPLAVPPPSGSLLTTPSKAA